MPPYNKDFKYSRDICGLVDRVVPDFEEYGWVNILTGTNLDIEDQLIVNDQTMKTFKKIVNFGKARSMIICQRQVGSGLVWSFKSNDINYSKKVCGLVDGVDSNFEEIGLVNILTGPNLDQPEKIQVDQKTMESFKSILKNEKKRSKMICQRPLDSKLFWSFKEPVISLISRCTSSEGEPDSYILEKGLNGRFFSSYSDLKTSDYIITQDQIPSQIFEKENYFVIKGGNSQSKFMTLISKENYQIKQIDLESNAENYIQLTTESQDMFFKIINRKNSIFVSQYTSLEPQKSASLKSIECSVLPENTPPD